MRSVAVSLSVCPLAYLNNHTAMLHQIFADVTFGRGSILLWRQYNTSCTSAFVDDVTCTQMSRHRRRGYGVCSKWLTKGAELRTKYDVNRCLAIIDN